MDLDKMSEIAGTGFFYARSPNGETVFARMGNEGEPEDMDVESFALTFGETVQAEDARAEASGILEEINRQRRKNFTLAPFAEQEQELRQTGGQAEMAGMLGQMMGGV